MATSTDQISEAEKAKKMRKRLKTTFNEALEAHDKAMNSESAIAKYNSSILRQLEKAFIANPEIDLISELPSNYSSALKNLAPDAVPDENSLEAALRPSKRLKTTDLDPLEEIDFEIPKHLQHLQGSGPVSVKSSMDESVAKFFPPDLTTNSVIKTLSQCELVAQDGGSGRKMIIKLDDDVIIKIVPAKEDSREYNTLVYLDEHCPEVPAPKPKGMMHLNGQDLMFMSYVRGATLEKVWPSLSQPQKDSVTTQLDQIFSKLRSQIAQDSQPWGGVGGEGCKDQRRRVRTSDRDIVKAEDFENFYFSNPKFGSDVYIKFLRKLYSASSNGQDARGTCVLTHGDLRQANIMVQVSEDGEVDITGIIDWEYSGFYPTWWESVKLTNCFDCHEKSDWFLQLPACISPMKYPTKWLLDHAWDMHVD